MFARDFYPAGAYSDPNAPYNECDVPERDFDIRVTVTLVHDTTVTTDKYCPEYDEETGHTDADTSDTDFRDVYEKNCYNVTQLMAYLKEYAERDMASDKPSKPKWQLRRIIDECDNWDIEETEVEEL